MQPRVLTRRAVIGTALGLFGLARNKGLAAVTHSATGSEAALPVVAALQVLAAVAGVIGTFMRSDGGMGAMLSAINQKLDLVIQQLASIQLSLADIVERLSELPDEIDELLKAEYVTDHVSRMRASMGEYLSIQRAMEARRKKGLPVHDASTKGDLDHLYRRFNDARRVLAVSPHGLRPDAAVFAPAAFTFDLAMNMASDVSDERLFELIRDYQQWFEQILDPSIANSTAGHILAATSRHDAAIDAIASTTIGSALGFQPGISIGQDSPIKIRIGGVQMPEIPGLDSVFVRRPPLVPNLNSRQYATFNCFDVIEQIRFSIGIGSGSATTTVPGEVLGVRVAADLRGETQKLSDDFEVRLMRYDVSEQTYRWPHPSMRPPTVPTPKQCEIVMAQPFAGDREALLKESDVWRRYQQDRATFDKHIREANGERIRIGAYAAVYASTALARTAAAKWIQRLGG